MKVITSKYTIWILALMTFALCFFSVQSGRLTDDVKPHTIIIDGMSLMEFSAPSAIVTIAPFLVLAILYGCQSRQAKELELILLIIGNSICFIHGANAARAWLLEIDAAIYGVSNISLLLYPFMFVLLCFIAILKNATIKDT